LTVQTWASISPNRPAAAIASRNFARKIGDSARTGNRYGLERVCRVLEFPRSTIYATRAAEGGKVIALRPQRRGPKPKVSDERLLEAIRADLAASPFVGEGHRKPWARLRLAGRDSHATSVACTPKPAAGWRCVWITARSTWRTTS